MVVLMPFSHVQPFNMIQENPLSFKHPLRKTRVVLLMVLGLFTFFVNLEQLPSDIMEQRNLVTAREIADEGNWLVPTMNGELRLQKPPLPTWVDGVVEPELYGRVLKLCDVADAEKPITMRTDLCSIYRFIYI